jgi:hypothetical protein
MICIGAANESQTWKFELGERALRRRRQLLGSQRSGIRVRDLN